MKGVFFSADFTKDASGDLKLLELNTNTATSYPEDLDLSELQQLLVDNSITTLHLLYTSGWHDTLAARLKELAAGLNIAVEETRVSQSTLFAPEVNDAEGTFILRLAYDEGATFDSEYTSQDINVLKLFANGTDDSLAVPFYFKGLDKTYDTLGALHLNDITLPDYVTKAATYAPQGVKFIKVGSSISDAEKLAEVKNVVASGTRYITPYLQHASDMIDGKVCSYRFYGVMYMDAANEPTYATLGAFKTYAVLDKAATLDTSEVINELPTKHFFEYSTNSPKLDILHGVPFNEVMRLDNLDKVAASDIMQGMLVDTYAMDTVPTHDDYASVLSWIVSGSELPAITNASSSVVTISDATPRYNIVSQIELEDGSSTLVGAGSYIVRYSPTEDNMKFVSTFQLKAGDEVLINGGNKVKVASSSAVVLHEEVDVRSFDVEEIDLYVVGENDLLIHNSPCFIKGTRIELEEGDLPIEEIVVGDLVKTFNHNTGEIELKEVKSILQKDAQYVVHYTLDNGTDIYATHDHPLYVEGKGYASYKPELTLSDSNLTVAQIEVGDVVKLLEGTAIITDLYELYDPETVYNLSDVEDNHNFFANQVLVHNRVLIEDQPCPDCCPSFGGSGACAGCGTTECCPECFECLVAGTEVTLSNGDVKNIEDMLVGEEVLSSSVVTGQQEAQLVLEVRKSASRVLVNTILENGTVLRHTQEHPHINSNGLLVSYRPDVTKAKGVYETDKPVKQLEVGTVLLTEKGTQVKVTELFVEEFDHEIDTYIIKVDQNANFYANGILTHNK